MNIPLTPNGDLFPVTPTRLEYEKLNIESVENFIFEDNLQFMGFQLVKATVMVELKGENYFYMLLKDFESLIPDLVKGKIKGRFTFKKTNEYYSIRRC